MTAILARLPNLLFETMTRCIVNEVPRISLPVYDITGKHCGKNKIGVYMRSNAFLEGIGMRLIFLEGKEVLAQAFHEEEAR